MDTRRGCSSVAQNEVTIAGGSRAGGGCSGLFAVNGHGDDREDQSAQAHGVVL